MLGILVIWDFRRISRMVGWMAKRKLCLAWALWDCFGCPMGCSGFPGRWDGESRCAETGVPLPRFRRRINATDFPFFFLLRPKKKRTKKTTVVLAHPHPLCSCWPALKKWMNEEKWVFSHHFYRPVSFMMTWWRNHANDGWSLAKGKMETFDWLSWIGQ